MYIPQKFPRSSQSSLGVFFEAKMREELMKKFAEDDRLEQVSEHKRRMKARALRAAGGARVQMGSSRRKLQWEINGKKGKRRGKMGKKYGENEKQWGIRCGLFHLANGDLKWKHCHL